MTGLPTLTVELEDGSGNFTNDVSQYVRLDKGWSLSRGWSDENDEDSIQPAVLGLRLDNSDGKFCLGASNFNGITKHKRLRLTETVGATVSRRCVVYVNDWPTEWDSALANMAFAKITASDRFMRLNRRKLRSITEQEIAADAPTAYYTLGESAGSTAAGDSSNNGRPSLALYGSGTALVFGAARNAWDGPTACTFAGQSLTALAAFTTTASLTLEVEMSFTSAPGLAGAVMALMSDGHFVRIEAAANVIRVVDGINFVVAPVNVVTAPTLLNDGLTHVIAVTISGTTWTLYVDGVSVGSAAATAITAGLSADLYVGNAFPTSAGATGPWLGNLANVAVWTAGNPSAARLLTHSDSIRNGLASDRADQRITRLAGYANIAPADLNLEVGLQPAMAPQSTSGQSVFDAMQDVAQSEGGGVFIAGDGKLTFHNKGHRVVKATGTPAITVTADLIDSDVTWASDNYLFNTATGTRQGGATQRSVNSTSVGKYEEWPITRDSALLPTDELVMNELQWVTTMYGEPLPRLSSVTFDLLTLPQATVQALLALELGDLMRITSWPGQSPAASVDLIVEGSKEEQTEKSWKITFNTAPGSLFKAWILGDSTYSVLGSTTRLHH